MVWIAGELAERHGPDSTQSMSIIADDCWSGTDLRSISLIEWEEILKRQLSLRDETGDLVERKWKASERLDDGHSF